MGASAVPAPSPGTSARYQDRELDTVASTASPLVKGINQQIITARDLDEVCDIYNTCASQFDTVCLATMWTKLAKMRNDVAPPAERLAFAHKHLLGKTLAMVGQMEVRPLANVLWALGSLRLDLTKAEPLGPHLAEQLEGRIRQLVAAGALDDDRHVAQLWYGMYFCKYPWPRQLLIALVAAQLPRMDSIDSKGLSEVLYCIKALQLKLGEEELQEMASIVERRALELDATEDTYRSLRGIIEAAEHLPLPLSPTCIKALHDLAITTPPYLAHGTLRTRTMSGMLFSLKKLGYVCTPYEASTWCDLLLGTWRAAPTSIDDFTFMLATLAKGMVHAPPEELREELVAVASRPSGWTPNAANRILAAARTFRVELPEGDYSRLERIAAAGQQQQGGTRAGRPAAARARRRPG